MIKRVWVRRYDWLPKSGQIIQSWDVANKQGEENDYSVCTTWLIYDKRYYLIDLLRGRFDFPTLRRKVCEQAKLHKASQILIEDAGFRDSAAPGTQDVAFPVVAVKPEYDKKIRMGIQAAKFENGQVLFPKEAPWLRDGPKMSFSRFQTAGTTIKWTASSQALGHKIAAFWTNESLDRYNNFLSALILARLS